MPWKDHFKSLALRLLPGGVLHRLKKMHYARTLRDPIEEREPDLRIVRELIQPGSYVIDIGANFGIYTKFLAEIVGDMGQVYSIEPIPLTYDILQANVRRLQLKNVETRNIAISDREGTVSMEVPLYASGGENFYEARIITNGNTDPRSEHRIETVPTMTLDSLFGHRREIDFIKCDVEGHELACLRGASEILRVAKPAWLIEVAGDPDEPQTNAAEVFRLLADRGYEPFWYNGKQLRPRRPGERSTNYFFLTLRHVRRLPSGLI